MRERVAVVVPPCSPAQRRAAWRARRVTVRPLGARHARVDPPAASSYSTDGFKWHVSGCPSSYGHNFPPLTACRSGSDGRGLPLVPGSRRTDRSAMARKEAQDAARRAGSVAAVSVAVMRKAARLLFQVLLTLNVIVALFFVSYFRLRRNQFGVISWDGTQIVLSRCRGRLLACLGLRHVNGFSEPTALLSFVARWLSAWLPDVTRSSAAAVATAVGDMGFRRLATPSPPPVEAQPPSPAPVASPRAARVRKTVTFNERVEVHLIPSSRPTYHAEYLNRYSFVNNFKLIPANTFVQQC
ncbi:villin-like 1 [Babesia caballi]|uniref:Villin-like 1 n=1 Tax=Babesia caballi TaxID=5871 RepID=A0AAV4LS24_BABCB|nr:villin-like 1 [Babesia caballi]